MRNRAAKWLRFALRWGVAIAGVYVVVFGLRWGDHVIVKGLTWRDHVLALDERLRPRDAVIVSEQPGGRITVRDERTGTERVVSRDDLVSAPDAKWVTVRTDHGGTTKVELLGVDLRGSVNRQAEVERLLVAGGDGGGGRWISPRDAVGYELKVPRPLVEVGLGTMLGRANPWLLVAAVAVFPLTYIITTIRWHAILQALEIHVTLMRAIVLNMVGAFYSTFMPGSTGGDLVKAIYASRQTTHKTRAVMSVIVDRAIGLVALVMLGGLMAGLRYWLTRQTPDPATLACRNVALACLALLLGLGVGLVLFFNATTRRVLGLEFVLSRLPMQAQVQKAIEAMAMLRQRPRLVFWTLVATFPVHITVVVSAMLACQAFGLKLTPGYYFVVVPVVVLVGSVPVSPQGAGVMEFFAILLLARQGATASEAIVLTMSIRMVQILWNMTGGVFVLRGGFHAPTQDEKRELETDEATPVGAR